MHHSSPVITQYRILGLAICLFGCTLIIIGANPDLPTWNFYHLSVQARVIARILTGTGLFLSGTLFAVWPEIRKGF